MSKGSYSGWILVLFDYNLTCDYFVFVYVFWMCSKCSLLPVLWKYIWIWSHGTTLGRGGPLKIVAAWNSYYTWESVCVCLCVCACACACVCMCFWDEWKTPSSLWFSPFSCLPLFFSFFLPVVFWWLNICQKFLF